MKKTVLTIESLETRDVPAILLTPMIVQFRDIDGDWAAVTLSKPLFTQQNVNTLFQFSQGGVDGRLDQPQQLQVIDLSSLDASALKGLDVSVGLARRLGKHLGNKQVDVGGIIALAGELSSISVQGDLGLILVGDFYGATSSIGKLTVNSLGVSDVSQGGKLSETNEPSQNRSSNFAGSVGSIVVNGPISHVELDSYQRQEGQSIGLLKVRGSIVDSTLNAGNVQLLQVQGDLIATGNYFSWGVQSITQALIDGSILGQSISNIDRMYLGGSIVGGSFENSANVQVRDVLIRGSIVAGAGMYSGRLIINSTIPNDPRWGQVSIGGSLVRDRAGGSGSIEVLSNLDRLMIGGKIKALTSALDPAISVSANAEIRLLKLQGLVTVGEVQDPISLIYADGVIDQIVLNRGIALSPTALDDATSVNIYSRNQVNLTSGGTVKGLTVSGGSIGTVRIHGDLINGNIWSESTIGHVVIEGNYFHRGSEFINWQLTAGIAAAQSIGTISIEKDLVVHVNVDASTSFRIVAGYPPNSNPLYLNGNIQSIRIGGNFRVISDSAPLPPTIDPGKPGIYATGRIGAISIGRDVSNVSIVAEGDTEDASNTPIGQVSIRGNAEGLIIYAGSITAGQEKVSTTHIDQVFIGGNMVNSLITAGAHPWEDGLFFNEFDAWLPAFMPELQLASHINRIVIRGHVGATDSNGWVYGIIAPEIKKLSIHNRAVQLNPGKTNDKISLTAAMNVWATEQLFNEIAF